MRVLRAACRVPAVVAVLLVAFLAVWLGAPFAVAAGRLGAWRSWVTRWWARALLVVLGVRLEVDGSPPRPPFLLVANHLGYLDILVLASAVPTAFVAKAEIAGWPVFGALARAGGTLFVDRGSRRAIPRVAAAMRKVMEEGRGVVLFPEGTSTRGDGVAPFRPSLLAPAAEGELPVHWAVLGYDTPAGSPPAHLSVCWWGEMELPGHLLGLLALPRIEARLAFGSEPVTDVDRKRLADRLHRKVTGRFVPAVDLEEGWL